MRARAGTFGDFVCAHCHALVSSAHWLSGGNNRNHCPYCLWSYHLDLYAAGDRRFLGNDEGLGHGAGIELTYGGFASQGQFAGRRAPR